MTEKLQIALAQSSDKGPKERNEDFYGACLPDGSVRENKGADRPVVPENERAEVLSALECVDFVTVFDDKTPLALLERLKPAVYAKGGDYSLDTIVQEERRLVEGYGGTIAIIPGEADSSTTRIIERITNGA